MKKALGAALLVALPSLAHAETQVPAIQTSATAAAATISTTTPTETHVAVAGVPATPPPALPLLGRSAPLNPKERHAVALARRWRNRHQMPHAGEDGYVRFLFGATLPTVVCAPLQVCNLALQPGEVVNSVNLGDSVRWKITPSLSGAGAAQTTHLIIKPTDAGLVSSLDIETNRRTYAIKLVSTESEWMPLVAFNYPDDAQAQWAAYRETIGLGAAAATLPTGESLANLQFLCIHPASGGPGWTPLRAYTDGRKTYIEFPSSLGAQAAPALVALGNDGGWFSGPSAQLVNYRVLGNRYVVDAVLDRAALISGVGGSQQRVTISRWGGCR